MKSLQNIFLKLNFSVILLTGTSAKADWGINLEQKVFIENKGQYDAQDDLSSKNIKFVIDNNTNYNY